MQGGQRVAAGDAGDIRHHTGAAVRVKAHGVGRGRGRAPPDLHFARHEILCFCTIRLGLILVGDRFSVCVHRQDTGRLIHCAALPVDRSFGIKRPRQSFHVKGSSGRQSALIIKLLII